MKLAGEAQVQGAPDETFDRLLDPELLCRCIPGCEGMNKVGEGRYETVVRAGIGPVKGRFDGVVTVSDVVRPGSYRLSVVGKSTAGYVDGGAEFRLEATDLGTRIHYAGEAKISGLLASVGGRLIDAAAKQVARQFFERLTAEVGARG